MILGIIADSHDNLHKLKKAVSLMNKKNVGMVLHAGDWVAPFAAGIVENNLKCDYRGIFGNNDGEKEGLTKVSKGKISSDKLELEIFGRKVIVVHDLEKANIALENYDIVVCGHTHKVEVKKENNTWVVNPGECGGWLSGKSSIVTLDLISDTFKVHIV